MEDQCSPLTLTWPLCNEEEGMEELRHSFLLATLELQKTILSAREEISRGEDEVIRLKDLLTKTLKERDLANAKCQSLLLEKLFLQQQQQQQQSQSQYQLVPPPLTVDFGVSEHSGTEERTLTPPRSPATARPLPEKGRLLKAVMEAGPLLQTLLLAGPLPQWQRPPPETVPVPLANIGLPMLQEEPWVAIGIASGNGCSSRKRGLMPSEFGTNCFPNKHQRVLN